MSLNRFLSQWLPTDGVPTGSPRYTRRGTGLRRAGAAAAVAAAAVATTSCARYPSATSGTTPPLLFVTFQVSGQLDSTLHQPYYYFIALQASPDDAAQDAHPEQGPFAVVQNNPGTIGWGNGWGTGKITDYVLYRAGQATQYSVNASDPTTLPAQVAAGGVPVGPPFSIVGSSDDRSVTIAIRLDSLGKNGDLNAIFNNGTTTSTTATTGATTATTASTTGATTSATTTSTTGATTSATTTATTGTTDASTTGASTGTTGATTSTTGTATTGAATTGATTTTGGSRTRQTAGTTALPGHIPGGVVVDVITTDHINPSPQEGPKPVDSLDIQGALPLIDLHQSKLIPPIDPTGDVLFPNSTVNIPDLRLTEVRGEVRLS